MYHIWFSVKSSLGSAEEAAVFKGPPRNARWAGQQGSNILIGDAPLSGRIPMITGGAVTPRAEVVDRWCLRRRAVRVSSTLFLKDASLNARGWLRAVMRAVGAAGRPEFTLDDVYAHEAALSALYPGNRNVRPKIRQQLQVLRDRGWLAFNGRGTYRLTSLLPLREKVAERSEVG